MNEIAKIPASATVPVCEPEPAADTWQRLEICNPADFGGLLPPIDVRLREDGFAQARIVPGTQTRNAAGGMHGAFLAAIAEQTLFLPLFLKGSCTRAGNVTVDFTLQFLAGGNPDLPLLALVELLRETGRMGFVRGTLFQDDAAILAYTGTIRKLRL